MKYWERSKDGVYVRIMDREHAIPMGRSSIMKDGRKREQSN